MLESITIIYTSLSSLKEAEEIARKVVELGLAACVNVISEAISFYQWEGEVKKTQECLLICKTANSKAKELQKWLCQQHPYSVPAILSGEVTALENFYDYVSSTAVSNK